MRYSVPFSFSCLYFKVYFDVFGFTYADDIWKNLFMVEWMRVFTQFMPEYWKQLITFPAFPLLVQYLQFLFRFVVNLLIGISFLVFLFPCLDFNVCFDVLVVRMLIISLSLYLLFQNLCLSFSNHPWIPSTSTYGSTFPVIIAISHEFGD